MVVFLLFLRKSKCLVDNETFLWPEGGLDPQNIPKRPCFLLYIKWIGSLFLKEDDFPALPIRLELPLNWLPMNKLHKARSAYSWPRLSRRRSRCKNVRSSASGSAQLIINNDSDVICRGCQIGCCRRASQSLNYEKREVPRCEEPKICDTSW